MRSEEGRCDVPRLGQRQPCFCSLGTAPLERRSLHAAAWRVDLRSGLTVWIDALEPRLGPDQHRVDLHWTLMSKAKGSHLPRYLGGSGTRQWPEGHWEGCFQQQLRPGQSQGQHPLFVLWTYWAGSFDGSRMKGCRQMSAEKRLSKCGRCPIFLLSFSEATLWLCVESGLFSRSLRAWRELFL